MAIKAHFTVRTWQNRKKEPGKMTIEEWWRLSDALCIMDADKLQVM
ncbi:MAG: hypothetical protein FWG91_11195 [Lachnospiraceae bacterium]|nr:hypothetical protein [Lachnospiraceae bacterium]